MTSEFERRRNLPYQDKHPLDREALRFIKSWHRAPELHDVLWYKGVNLGEMCEYHLFPEVIRAMVADEEPQDS